MKLSQTLYDELKIPLGKLVLDKQVDSATLCAHVADASCIITVGDRTTERLIEFGVIPHLQIVDGQEKRFSRDLPQLLAGTVEMTCDNPASQITEQSIKKIKDAFVSDAPVRLTVNGEEDLLVIAVCIHAPKNSVACYGQPDQGMVLVNIDQKTRRKTQRLLDLIKNGG